MSNDVLTEIFLQSASLADRQDLWLDNIIKKELAELVASIPQWGDTGCTLADIGEFLVCTTTLLSRLANRVVYGEHINIYTERIIQENVIENDFSELTFLDYMEEKHDCLKSIASKLQVTAEDTDESWNKSSKLLPGSSLQNRGRKKRAFLPLFPTMASGSAYQPHPPIGVQTQQLEQFETHQTSNLDVQKEINREPPILNLSVPQNNADVQFSSLSTRGKGHHTCPQGTSCSKGGVTPNGELVTFERNSAFRAHLQKHEKRYKCDIPGCTNRKGFARKDQLQRHKTSITHSLLENTHPSHDEPKFEVINNACVIPQVAEN